MLTIGQVPRLDNKGIFINHGNTETRKNIVNPNPISQPKVNKKNQHQEYQLSIVTTVGVRVGFYLGPLFGIWGYFFLVGLELQSTLGGVESTIREIDCKHQYNPRKQP